MGDRMVRVQVGEPSRRMQGLQDVRRGRLTPAPNRGRNLNVPPVAYLPPIEEPEEIEMDVIGLERFDGARRRSGTNHLEGAINLQRASIRNNGSDSDRLETCRPCDLTIVQAWTMFGYGTLTLPAYVSYDAGSNEYVLKSNIIQKILCFVQHGFAMVEEVMRIREIRELFNHNPTPFTFIQISCIFVSIGSRAWFFKVSFMNMGNLLDYHNAVDTDDDDASWDGNPIHSKKMGLLSFVGGALFTLLMVGLDSIILLNNFDNQWTQAAGPITVQAFACYARKTYMWRDDLTCGSEYFAASYFNLSYSDILFGILGKLTFFNAKIALYQRLIGLDAVNAAFYRDASNAMNAIQNEDTPVRSTYDNLKRRSEQLSYFAGPLLMLQLLEIGMNIPQWSFAIFVNNLPVTFLIILMVLGFYSFVFLSCIGAHTCERIRDEMMGPRGQSERPFSARDMIAWMANSFWNNVGIGFNGIFVLNFAFFMTYMTFVGAWIMVLYEVEH